MEAFILMMDVVVMTYLCWRIHRNDSAKGGKGGLGWLAYKEGDKP